MNYIYHVTLNTGHVAKQRRHDVDDHAVATLSEVLDVILQGGYIPVPGFEDYIVNGTHGGFDLIATVWIGPWERRVPLVTMATALKSHSAPALWRLMHVQATTPLATANSGRRGSLSLTAT